MSQHSSMVTSCWTPRLCVADASRYILAPSQVASLPPVPTRLRASLGTSDYARLMAYYVLLDEEAQREQRNNLSQFC